MTDVVYKIVFLHDRLSLFEAYKSLTIKQGYRKPFCLLLMLLDENPIHMINQQQEANGSLGSHKY